MKELLIPMPTPQRIRTSGSRTGSSVVEMALLLPLFLLMAFGGLTVSLFLERDFAVLQLVRYAGGMYARGTDFNLLSNKQLLLLGAGGLGMTVAGGNGVVYLSTVRKAAPSTKNANRLVIYERFVIGNPALVSSSIGTPSSAIWPDTTQPLPNGLVGDYQNQASALATLPAAFATIDLNQRILVVEVCHNPVDYAGLRLVKVNRLYSRAFF